MPHLIAPKIIIDLNFQYWLHFTCALTASSDRDAYSYFEEAFFNMANRLISPVSSLYGYAIYHEDA